jgi:hypothetical protein
MIMPLSPIFCANELIALTQTRKPSLQLNEF